MTEIEDEQVCIDDYPEHDAADTYDGEDGVQWECRRCGVEGWEPAEQDEESIDLGVLEPGAAITPEPGTTVTWSE